MKLEGDDHISGFDSRIWNLTYHILLKYQVPVRFKFHLGNAWQHMDSYLEWFIPECDQYEEIENFIVDEFSDDICDGEIIKCKDTCVEGSDKAVEMYHMGLKVLVWPYSGEDPYLERVERNKLAEHFSKYFMEKVKKQMKEKDSGPDK